MASLLLALCFLLPASTLAKDYFTAAVFEHRPVQLDCLKGDPTEIKLGNLHYYERAAKVAAQKGTDIILFNEYGTTVNPTTREGMARFAEQVPDPKKIKYNPCLEEATDKTVLYRASCMAREHRMYIVVNMIDVQPCDGSCDAAKVADCDTKCPDDGVDFFNTDVAFDREGNLIARYHKMHPYFEIAEVSREPEFITFDTDFGRFGMIVCFDMVFEESVKLIQDHGVDTMLFPTFWFDEIVPLVSVEFQQAYAIAHGINLMAANTHTPGMSSIGSGIYTKDGALVYTYEPNGVSKLLVANIRTKAGAKVPDINTITAVTHDHILPIVETGEEFPKECYEPLVGAAENPLEDYRCFKRKVDNYTVVRLEAPSGKVQACNNGFCCSLSYSAEEMKNEFYLAAFNGLNNAHGFNKWWEESCVLTRCEPHEGSACVLQPFTSNTVFRKVKLEANFKSKTVYPAVSSTHLRLTPTREWNFERKGDKGVVKFQSHFDKPLLRVSLIGRDFERDPPFVPFNKF